MATAAAVEHYRRQAALSHYDLAEPITQADIDAAGWLALQTVTGDDLHNELWDVRDLLVQLVQRGSPDKAGAVVFAVCKGYAARLGMRDLSPDVADNMPDAVRLAQAVLVGGAV